MIYLGIFKAGDTVFYAGNFHNDTGTLEAPTGPEAQIRTPAGVWSALTAPAVQNGKTGHFGGTVDTTGYAAGQYVVRMAGTVTTAKTVATEFCFTILTGGAAQESTLLALGQLPTTAHVFTAGERIVVPQGDVMSLPFALGSAHDCTGKKLYFYAWDNATGALFITKLECTLTDSLNVIGTVPLTATHLATLRSCTYEYVRFDADGTSNKHTIVQGPMVIDDSLAI